MLSVIVPRTPRSTLFPYTTLFRSERHRGRDHRKRGGELLAERASRRHDDRARGGLDYDQLFFRNLDGGPQENAAGLIHTGNLRSEEHTSELQSLAYLVCRLLLEKK